MQLACALIASLAIVLAWPAPIILSRAEWTARSPGVALALWQAIALGGGLSMIGALLGFGILPLDDGLLEAIPIFAEAAFHGPLPAPIGVVQMLALSGAVILGAHLFLNLAQTVIRTERRRRRHHALVGILSSPMTERPSTRVLDHPAPLAYCVPGVRTVTVLSNGLVDLLDDDELDAVLAHERSHLRQYHHLVLLAFQAWNTALPWFPIANRAEFAVAGLVEMLADDEATRTVSKATLARAIARVGDAWDAPDASGGAGRSVDRTALELRANRLDGTRAPLGRAARGLVLGIASLIVIAPAVFLLLLL
jgi:Zn-dependent protease with chaperone function